MNEENKSNNIRNWIVLYMDIVVRGLIAFLFVGVCLSFLLIGYFKMSFIYVLPIVFITSVLISPFLSKIRLGEFIISKYENFLNKLFEKTMGNGK